MPLFCIIGPDDLEVTIVAPDALQALRMHHTEALGEGSVRCRGDGLWFKRPEDQRLCAGRWVVVRQATNGSVSGNRRRGRGALTPADRSGVYDHPAVGRPGAGRRVYES